MTNFKVFKDSIYNSCEHMLRISSLPMKRYEEPEQKEPINEEPEEKESSPIKIVTRPAPIKVPAKPEPEPKNPLKRNYGDSDSDD